MFKFSKKKEIKAEVNDVSIDEINGIIEKIIKCYKENNKSWSTNKTDRTTVMKDVVEYDPIYYKINAAVLKYERQLETANITDRVEIAQKLNILLKFTQEYNYEIFDMRYWEYGPRNYEYVLTKRQLTKKLLKFLEPEIKEYKAQVKEEERQRISRIKENDRKVEAERRDASLRRSEMYDQIKKM